MKPITTFVLIVGLLNSVYSQDTIYTIDGDTILANLLEIDKNRIFYTKWGKRTPKSIRKSSVKRTAKDLNRSDLSRDLKIISSDGCLWERDEKDKYTGVYVLETTEKYLHYYFEQKVLLSFKREDSTYFLHMKYKNGELRNIDIDKDGLLILILENGEQVRLKAITHFSEDKSYEESISDYSAWVAPIYSIQRKQILMLANSVIKEFRIYFREGFADHNELPDRYKKNIQQLAQCILNN